MDDLESKALKVLIEHEAISECDIHKGVYLDNGDPEAVSKAYAAAAEMVAAGEIETTKEKFMAAIGAVLADSSEDCPQCEGEEED
jgi:hypothetical protein